MNGYSGSASPPGQLYVRALYDYEADDQTSLSFRQGDIIQVITQLESGWWDGVIHGVRGWFPSNYCSVLPDAGAYDDGMGDHMPAGAGESETEESEEEFADHELGHAPNASANRTQEEAAFWIPQATPDGRLFYFNTLTGASTMELPLESPSSVNEGGPRDRTNVFIPDQTRPPAELMAGSYDRDEDTDYASASETEDTSFSKGSSVSYAKKCVRSNAPVADVLCVAAPTTTVIPVGWRVTRHIDGFLECSIYGNAITVIDS
jgi:son of sevenless-like protein